jgi:uroporphyrinogen decarboxylase
MTSRERVEIALNMEKPDRCPMQISFTPEFAKRLQANMNIRDSQIHNPHGGGNLYVLEKLLQEDMLLTSVGWANSYYQSIQVGSRYTDEWGIGWKVVEYETRFGKGVYTEIEGHPLNNDDAVLSYIAPDPNRDELYTEAKNVLTNYKSSHWIVGVTVTTIFETAWALRGFPQMLTDFLVNPDLANRILDIPYNYHLTAAKNLVELGVDMIWTGDDVGTQSGMLISPENWRLFFKPRMADFISELKKINPAVKVAYHSDGNISAIIPELIEIGIDVLNPVQPACMDPAVLKKLYGDKLCFWGSIDEQYTLPFGTPEEVRNEVVKRIKTLGKNGGLIIGPTHHVQLDTSLENFWAMHETILNTKY